MKFLVTLNCTDSKFSGEFEFTSPSQAVEKLIRNVDLNADKTAILNAVSTAESGYIYQMSDNGDQGQIEVIENFKFSGSDNQQQLTVVGDFIDSIKLVTLPHGGDLDKFKTGGFVFSNLLKLGGTKSRPEGTLWLLVKPTIMLKKRWDRAMGWRCGSLQLKKCPNDYVLTMHEDESGVCHRFIVGRFTNEICNPLFEKFNNLDDGVYTMTDLEQEV